MEGQINYYEVDEEVYMVKGKSVSLEKISKVAIEIDGEKSEVKYKLVGRKFWVDGESLYPDADSAFKSIGS